ncbi:MAG: phosphoesterase PA-phosphatase related protein [Fibrobacteres bacterium]|nr:phosphoesterase PA-phosphatase related protein [Fibrobacterota bacterium]
MDTAEIDRTEEPSLRSGISALTSRVTAVDVGFFRMLAAWSMPKPVTLLLILLVRIGDGWMWGAIALYLWWALPFAELEMTVLHCILSIGISLCFYLPIKFIMKRPRPYDSGLDVTPLVPPLDKYSFPSGHTMNNLAVALTLALHLPRLIVPAILLPVVMGMLRILFGVHYLSDIVGGTVLGTVAFFISKAIFPAIDL